MFQSSMGFLRLSLACLVVTISFVAGLPVFASSQVSDESYYTVDESFSFLEQKQPVLENPVHLLSAGLSQAAEKIAEPRDKPVILTRWVRHHGSPGFPSEDYNRVQHFGRWLNDPTDTNCYDTRAKVLIRDSYGKISFKPNNRCRVDSGVWHDPYTNRNLYNAKDLQIDHFVPLKNAYVSGAWKWDVKKRCLYANFLSNDYHLIAVDARENMRKSDRTPERYLPPNEEFVCDYLQRWLKVKLIWNLTMTAGESEAIRDELDYYNCDLRKMKMSRKELKKQRSEIVARLPICEKRALKAIAPQAEP